MTKLTRRNFIKASGAGALAATTAAAATTAISSPAIASALSRPANLPPAKGPRVVVIGGGTSGTTMAKYLKKENPKFDVVLVEPNSMFMWCPLSNIWLAGGFPIINILRSYVDAARNNNYTWLQGSLVDLDRGNRVAMTTVGAIAYDFVVVAPGIDYNYASVGVKDPADQIALYQKYPPAFKPGSEHLTLKAKLEDFDGGNFVLTVPTGNYRCLPAPYERSCLIADYFIQNKIKGKVVLLDPNPQPTIKAPGFLAAFSELYKDVIEYKTSTTITGVDVGKKKVMTEFGEVDFADAAIYPRVRAARLIEDLGLHDSKSPQMEAKIDNYNYNFVGDKRTYVTGDARPMPFSKSANTSNSEAHHVAKVIAARSMGKEIKWQSPNTICYSMVQMHPKEESIWVNAFYKSDGHGGGWGFTDVKVDNKRSVASGAANLDWGKTLLADMFES